MSETYLVRLADGPLPGVQLFDAAEIPWPPPDELPAPGCLGRYVKVSQSEINDEDMREMRHVVRGAEYEWRREVDPVSETDEQCAAWDAARVNGPRPPEYDGPCCAALGPWTFGCTRALGHSGQHVATAGDEVAAVWTARYYDPRPVIPVRVDRLPHVISTYPAPGPAVAGECCPACDEELAGPVALVHIGPGDDPTDQAKARAGRWHTGAAVAVHAACAGVETTEETP